jgi:adenosylcobinamide-GDP ribazoletransferase
MVAVQFLTRLPVPAIPDYKPWYLDGAARYFPAVGLMVGAISAGVLWAASQIWPAPVPAILAVAAGIAITGAFHEDGLADFFDCLGGQTPDARLTIMKDSRLGTFGTLALGVVVALKIAALSALPLAAAMLALLSAHAVARLAALCAIPFMPYAADVQTAKAAPLLAAIRPGRLAFAALFAILPLLWLPPANLAVGLLATVAATAVLIRQANRLLGGYTGDVLGAIEQTVEVVLLLSLSASLA